jgi:hypothetical protein
LGTLLEVFLHEWNANRSAGAAAPDALGEVLLALALPIKAVALTHLLERGEQLPAVDDEGPAHLVTAESAHHLDGSAAANAKHPFEDGAVDDRYPTAEISATISG